MSNLDAPYFKKNLERILRDIDCYTAEEMNTSLTRLAYVASKSESFESELHDLITKYNLDHSTLTPEFIKQQIMRDNITTHNEPLRNPEYYLKVAKGLQQREKDDE